MIWLMRVIGLICLVVIWAMFPARAGGAPTFVAPGIVEIPAGPFIRGSDQAEREAAYRLDERAYGHSTTRQRKWYEDERRRTETTKTYAITRTTITNRDYAVFIRETGHGSPDVDVKTWKGPVRANANLSLIGRVTPHSGSQFAPFGICRRTGYSKFGPACEMTVVIEMVEDRSVG